MKVSDDAVTTQLRQQMREVRQDLRGDIEELASQARQLTDWRHYVRQSPWLSLGTAAFAAYLMVPAKRHVKTLSRGDVEALAKEDRVFLKPRSQSAESPGPMGMILRLAMAAFIRAGVGYVSHQVGVMMDKKQSSPPEGSPATDPRPSGRAR